MKQSFSKKQYKDFEKYLKIKEKPGKWEKLYSEKALSYLKYIKWIPGIQMVGIGNSIAMNAAKKSSDIDLYIVTKENYLRQVRIIITFIFQILGVRKNAKNHEGRFCLSFFSTRKGMDFSPFVLKNDIYLYFWVLSFQPLLNYDHCYESFLEINKKWADFSLYEKELENNKNHIVCTNIKTPPEPPLSGEEKPHPNPLLKEREKNRKIEKILKGIFMKKTIKTYEKIGKPFGVIINDTLLKFHNNDIRKNIKKSLDI